MMSDNGSGSPRRMGVQPFDRAMIQDHLERNDLKFTTDEDGDFRVDFAPVAEGGPEISVWLTAEGANEDIFVIRVVANAAIPKTSWPGIVDACNRWNQEKRYPKAFLMIPVNVEELFAPVHLEGQFPMSAGATQPMVDEFISTIIGTGFSFWQWLAEEGILTRDDGGVAND